MRHGGRGRPKPMSERAQPRRAFRSTVKLRVRTRGAQRPRQDLIESISIENLGRRLLGVRKTIQLFSKNTSEVVASEACAQAYFEDEIYPRFKKSAAEALIEMLIPIREHFHKHP